MAVRPPTPAAELPPGERSPPPPGENYYIIIFGSQSVPIRAKYTHTWATMVKVIGGPGGQVEPHTISWMPATLEIRPLSGHPEPGRNLELHETITLMLANRERVSQWGPYEVYPTLHRRFLVQKAFIESDAVGYQCVDTWGEAGRKGNGSDCIHAITDMDPEYDRGFYPLRRFGEAGSAFIARQLHVRGVMINPEADQSWLNEPLGLTCYPIVHRPLPC
jgi:hypothetical protein